jgi:hypothetical protein
MRLIIKINKEPVGEYQIGDMDEFSVEVVQSEQTKSQKFFEKEQVMFEYFRKAFPGKKRGLETEFLNFRKKTKDWKEALPKLYAAVLLEKEDKAKAKYSGRFVPEWKNLQTWINNRCWEIEYETKQTPTLPITVNFQNER